VSSFITEINIRNYLIIVHLFAVHRVPILGLLGFWALSII